MDEKVFCQSCGMPMETEEQFGTNEDGSLNRDYCVYCYQKGAFAQECTMDEMIEGCLEYGKDFFPDQELARKQMQEFFPALKRWKKED